MKTLIISILFFIIAFASFLAGLNWSSYEESRPITVNRPSPIDTIKITKLKPIVIKTDSFFIRNMWIKKGTWIYWRYEWESEYRLNKSVITHISKDNYGYILEFNDGVFSYNSPVKELYFRLRY